MLALLCTRWCGRATAEEKPQLEGIQVTTLADGLHYPCGVAVRPGTAGERIELAVADSGTGRVVAFSATQPAELTELVVGLPVGSHPRYPVGPLGLLYLSRQTLLVGDGGLPAGQALVRGYRLTTQGLPLDAAKAKFQLGPLPAGKLSDSKQSPSKQSTGGEGMFYALARRGQSVYITSGIGDEQGWVLQAEVRGLQLDELKPLVATTPATGVAGPRGITLSPKGYLLVSQVGALDPTPDSAIGYFDPTGRLPEPALVLPVPLLDVVAIAYSPQSELLYAADFAADAPERGGIYRLDAAYDEQAHQLRCQPVLVTSLVHPAALVFDDEATLYVTTFGPGAKTGQLLKISGNL